MGARDSKGLNQGAFIHLKLREACLITSACLAGFASCKPEPIDTREVLGISSVPTREDHVRSLEQIFLDVLSSSGMSQAKVDQLRLTLDGKVPPEGTSFVDMILSWVEVSVSRLGGSGESPLFTVQVSSTLALELASEARHFEASVSILAPPAEDFTKIVRSLASAWNQAKIPIMEMVQGFALINGKAELVVGEMNRDEIKAIILDEVMSILLTRTRPGFEKAVGDQREAVSRAISGQSNAAQKVALVLEDYLLFIGEDPKVAAGRAPLLGVDADSDNALLCYAYGDDTSFEYLWELNGVIAPDWVQAKVTVDLDESAEYRCAARKWQADAPWAYSTIFRTGRIVSGTVRVSLEPAFPVSGDRLSCKVQMEEPMSEGQWSYTWSRNGSPVLGIVGSDFPGPLEKGDQWQCEAHLDGDVAIPSKSLVVTVGNSAPVFSSSPTVSALSQRVFSSVRCRFPGVSESDGKDILQVQNSVLLGGIRFLNGQTLRGGSQDIILPAFSVLPGDVVSCLSEAFDGTIKTSREAAAELNHLANPLPIFIGGHAYQTYSDSDATFVAAGYSGIEIFVRTETNFSRSRIVRTIDDSVALAIAESWMASRSSSGKVEIFSLDRMGSRDPSEWRIQSASQLSRSGEIFSGLTLDGDVLALGSSLGRVYVVDLAISASGGPFTESVLQSPSSPYLDIQLSQRRLYAMRDDALDVFDLTSLTAPTPLASLVLSSATHFSQTGDLVYVAAADGGVTRWNLSDLANPAQQGTYLVEREVVGLHCRSSSCAVLDGARDVITVGYSAAGSPQKNASGALPAPGRFVQIVGALGEVHVSLASAGLLRLNGSLSVPMKSSHAAGSFHEVVARTGVDTERYLLADDFGISELEIDSDSQGARILSRIWSEEPVTALVPVDGGFATASPGGRLEWREADSLAVTKSHILPTDIAQIFAAEVGSANIYVRLTSGVLQRYRRDLNHGFVLVSEVQFSSPALKCIPLGSLAQTREVACSLSEEILVLVNFADFSNPQVTASREVPGLRDFAVKGDLVLAIEDRGLSIFAPHLGGTEWSLRSTLLVESRVWQKVASSPTEALTFAVSSNNGVVLFRVDSSGQNLTESAHLELFFRSGEEQSPLRMVAERLFLGLRGTAFY